MAIKKKQNLVVGWGARLKFLITGDLKSLENLFPKRQKRKKKK